MTPFQRSRLTSCLVIPALTAAMLLGGCGGVQFEGKVFEMVGLADDGKPKKDPKVKPRAPLVMPPTATLPEPGTRTASTEPENWPADPEEAKRRELAEAKRKLEQYRRHGDFSDRAGIEEFERIYNPMSRRPGVLADKASGSDVNSDDSDYVSPDINENIKDNVDVEKLQSERRRQADVERQDPDNSWVSKPGDERVHAPDGPDDVENMKSVW